MYRFEKLIAWQKAMDLMEAVYAATMTFPEHERFGLTSQTRRASTSIVLNLAEGSAADSKREFVYFCRVARKSQFEVASALRIALRLKYLDDGNFTALDRQTSEVGRLIVGLIEWLKKPPDDSTIKEDGSPAWDYDAFTAEDFSWWTALCSDPDDD